MDLNNFFQELDKGLKTKNIKDVEAFVLASMETAQKERNIPAFIAIANELGGIYRVTSRFEEGKKVVALAESAIRQLGLENTEQHGTTLLNLASIYSEAKESKEALKLYEQASSIFQAAGLQKDYRLAALYNNISRVYEDLGETGLAMAHAEKALEIIRQLPENKVELATTYTTLAIIYTKQNRMKEAETCLHTAEQIFLALPGKRDVHYGATLNALGEIRFIQGQFDQAAQYFRKALEAIKENYGVNSMYHEVEKNLAKATGQSGKRKSGLELSEDFYLSHGKKMIQENFSAFIPYMAIGLVGEGSECLGFDDEISEDHDFNPGFCIWLPDEQYQEIGPSLKAAYDRLPNPSWNKKSLETLEGRGRTGVFRIGDFYKKYIGCPGVPKNNVEWLLAPEIGLSIATNGKVFEDNLGEFSRIRSQLLAFYPKDIFLKKLAAKMAQISQAGQYNYERCMKREDYAAAYISCSEFIQSTVALVYLLNETYRPFYKWMFRGMNQLKHLPELKFMLSKLSRMTDVPENTEKKVAAIEEICIRIIEELNRRELIKGNDAFLASHCNQLMNGISDSQIRNLPVIFDGK